MSSKISDLYDQIKGPDGRTRLVLNEKRRQARKPAGQRSWKKNGVKVVRRSASSVNRPI